MRFDILLTEEELLKAGYKKQWCGNGFFRKTKNGRFHIYLKNRYKEREFISYMDIHFDFYFRESGHPSTFYTPQLLKEEIKRIKNE